MTEAAREQTNNEQTETQRLSNRPLSGVRVLDFSRVLSGPFCTMLLADMGAEVVKVEPPVGDETRGWGPPFQNGESAYFMSINRNKRSIVLDLSSTDGQIAAQRMAAASDVVIENFRPGKTSKLGIDYDTLSQLNPSLVYCSISGFGQESPLVNQPGYDFIAQAMTGLMSLTGEPEGDAVKAGVPTADLVTGLYAVIGILAALHKKSVTGHGEYIDISLFDSQLSLASQVAANYLVSGKAPRRYGNAHPNIVPYQSLPTSDGSIAVAVGNDGQFARFCSALDLCHLASDDRYRTNKLRIENRDSLIAEIAHQTRTRPTHYWVNVFDKAEIPNGPIQTLPEALEMEHVKARKLIWESEHPTTGIVKMLGNPIRFSSSELSAVLPPPLAGEHSYEVLRQFGYSDDEIVELVRKGAVRET